MEEALLEVINRIVEVKRQSGVFPLNATSREVYDEVAKSLNSLYTQGKIEVGDTLNYKWIVISANNDTPLPTE